MTLYLLFFQIIFLRKKDCSVEEGKASLLYSGAALATLVSSLAQMTYWKGELLMHLLLVGRTGQQFCSCTREVWGFFNKLAQYSSPLFAAQEDAS